MSIITGFAEACYDMNSIRELLDASAAPEADATDCKSWNLTPREWYSQIAEALAHKLADDYSAFSEYVDPDETTSEAEFDAMTESARIAMIAEVLASNDTRRWI